MSLPQDHTAANPETAYEPSDWHVGAIGIVLAMILVIIAIAVAALFAGFPIAAFDVERRMTTAMPEPALQTDPAQDLAKLRAREDQRLNGYYWIDREKGILHIPIEEAMKQVVARGLDGFPQGQP